MPSLSQPTADRVGLTDAERAEFYHLEEGSEVFPLSWFLALERDSDQTPFAEGLERFGFIPDGKNPANPYGLPVGITAAQTRDLKLAGVQMVGVNCAACHVSEMNINGQRVRLDGAPSRVDVNLFYSSLAKAAVATAQDPRKFLRFLRRVRAASPSEVLTTAEADKSTQVLGFEPTPQNQESARFDAAVEAELIAALNDEAATAPLDISAGLTLQAGAEAEKVRQDFERRLRETSPRPVAVRSLPVPESFEAFGSPDQVRADVIPAAVTDAIIEFRLLKSRVNFLRQIVERLDVEATVPGFGRIDAFGGARNLLFTAAAQPNTAPVSYPHLWNFERLDWLHWDGNTTSVLERNMGQALGLGAVLDPRTWRSTLSLVNLHRLEQLSRKIRPPRWEEAIGPIDAALAQRGQEIFKTNCASCHDAGLDDAATLHDLTAVGTDPRRALNFGVPVGAKPISQAIAELLQQVKQQAFKEKGFTKEQQDALDGARPSSWRVTGKYAARPLIAVWASAPYLHNNSVPTLEHLLLPEASRPQTFAVGSAQYDAVKLGYSTGGTSTSWTFDTRLPGNSNSGHLYGTTLPSSDRKALLEYLKGF